MTNAVIPTLSRYRQTANITCWRISTLAFAVLMVSRACAHPAQVPCGIATIDQAGNVKIVLTIDLPAFALNDTPQRVSDVDMNALIDGPRDELAAQLSDARDRLLHSSSLKDGVLDSATVPVPEDVSSITGPVRFPMMMDVSLRGHLSDGARGFSLKLPEAMGSIVLTVDRPDAEPRAFAVDEGDYSPEVPITIDRPAARVSPGVTEARSTPVRSTGIGIALLLLGWFCRRFWQRRSIVGAVSAMIAIFGFFWMVRGSI